jgi:peptidoglycan hydrolase-like protein with peptidoglycan-binding domain
MLFRLFLVALLIAGFSGCAASCKRDSGAQVQELQAQISELERKIGEKEQDIYNLEQALQETKAVAEKTVTESAAPKITTKNIQTALKAAGFYDGAIDGKIGQKTKQAILDFQKANNLTADGVVGKKTWEALKKYL